MSLPDLPRIRKILDKENLFVVVQDAFLTETAARADVVLPTAMWDENLVVSPMPIARLHPSDKAIDPPGEARSDFDIFVDYCSTDGFSRHRSCNRLIKWGYSRRKHLKRGSPAQKVVLVLLPDAMPSSQGVQGFSGPARSPQWRRAPLY